MADVQGANYKTVRQAGEYGNLNVAILSGAFAAQADADVLVLGHLAGSINIVRAVAITGDMGAPQTMDIGYRYSTSTDGTDDPDGFFDGIDTGAADATNAVDLLTAIDDGDGIDVVASNIGDVATGDIDVIVYYEYVGQ